MRSLDKENLGVNHILKSMWALSLMTQEVIKISVYSMSQDNWFFFLFKIDSSIVVKLKYLRICRFKQSRHLL